MKDSVCPPGWALEESNAGGKKKSPMFAHFWRVWILFTNLLFIPEASCCLWMGTAFPPGLSAAQYGSNARRNPTRLCPLIFTGFLWKIWRWVAFSHFRNTRLARSYFWSFLLKPYVFVRFSVFLNQFPSHSLPEVRSLYIYVCVCIYIYIWVFFKLSHF